MLGRERRMPCLMKECRDMPFAGLPLQSSCVCQSQKFAQMCIQDETESAGGCCTKD